MARADVTVRVASLDGTWETLGSAKARGIVPENVQYSHDTWGSQSASFVLKRDPAVPWPDLSAFTPVDIWVGGAKTWSGRIDQTPTTDGDSRQVAVACKGWQYHLDDDVYEGKYVHTRVSDWRDYRTFPDAVLGSGASGSAHAGGQVANDNGTVVLAFPSGVPVASGCLVGVVLDLGPNNAAASVSIDYETSANHASLQTYVRAIPNTATGPVTGYSNIWNDTLNSYGASGTISADPATPSRYVIVFLQNTSGGALTPAAGVDYWFKIKAARVFGATTYRSGSASVLKASQVITDALSRAAPLLSTDTSQISTATFSIPEYAPDGNRTPREHIAAVNAYENYMASVDVDQHLVYTSRPSSPVIEVGAWSGAAFEDASTNSAQDIYNRVIVEGTGPDGQPLRAERAAGQLSGVLLRAIATPVPDNPSFDTNTASWTGTITRDTGTYDSSPASGSMPVVTSTGASTTFTGTFLKGITYILRFALFSNTPTLAYDPLRIAFGSSTSYDYTLENQFILAGSTWEVHSIGWTPSVNTTSVGFTIAKSPATDTVKIDSLQLFTSSATLPDRRGFRRTMILGASSAMTALGGITIGERYLANHDSTPLKGSLKVTGPTGVRRVQGGAGVHPSQLGLLTNQLVRLSHRIDFDNGNVGKDGTIVAVSYDHASESATVEIDNRSSNFEALMSRLAVNVGQVA